MSARGKGDARASPPALDGRFEIFFSSGETRLTPLLFNYLGGWTNTTKTFNQIHETLPSFHGLAPGMGGGGEGGWEGRGVDPVAQVCGAPQDSASHRNPVHTPCRPKPCLPGASCWGRELRDRVKRLWLQLGL